MVVPNTIGSHVRQGVKERRNTIIITRLDGHGDVGKSRKSGIIMKIHAVNNLSYLPNTLLP